MTDPVIIDLYKMAVEMADRVSARRASANTYFLTLHTGLAAFVGVLSSARRPGGPPRVDDAALAIVSGAGAVLAIAWWLLLRSYRDLNRAKFKVINEIEAEHLPVHVFTTEDRYLKGDDPVPSLWGRYAELGLVERVVPVVFLGVYIGLALRVLSG